MTAVRNVVFDLGGVLYAIDPPRMWAALTALAADPESVARLATPPPGEDDVLARYERGAISTADFRDAVRRRCGMTASDAAFDAAWNAVLRGVFPEAVGVVRALAGRGRIALLSNTNALHHAAFAPACADLFAPFERCFFSHQLGAAKPEPTAFARVLDAMGFAPEETLLVDDLAANVAAARALGLRTWWVTPERPIRDLLTAL